MRRRACPQLVYFQWNILALVSIIRSAALGHPAILFYITCFNDELKYVILQILALYEVDILRRTWPRVPVERTETDPESYLPIKSFIRAGK